MYFVHVFLFFVLSYFLYLTYPNCFYLIPLTRFCFLDHFRGTSIIFLSPTAVANIPSTARRQRRHYYQRPPLLLLSPSSSSSPTPSSFYMFCVTLTNCKFILCCHFICYTICSTILSQSDRNHTSFFLNARELSRTNDNKMICTIFGT